MTVIIMTEGDTAWFVSVWTDVLQRYVGERICNIVEHVKTVAGKMYWAKKLKQQIGDWQETPGPFCAYDENLIAKAMPENSLVPNENTTKYNFSIQYLLHCLISFVKCG
jgi:hypothetical protein